MTDFDLVMAGSPNSGPDGALSAAALLSRFQLCADSGGSFIKFSGVSPLVFEEFYTLLDSHGRVTYFGAASGVLVVKMPNLWHEVVAIKTMDVAQRQLPAKDFLRVGSTRYESDDGSLAAKEADDGIIPKHRLLGRGGVSVPSFVLEVANTQSLADARESIKWWFQKSSPNNPQRGVQCGLIAKIGDPTLGDITFELWRRNTRYPKTAHLQLIRRQQQPKQELNPDH
jgi:hypothetical protein